MRSLYLQADSPIHRLAAHAKIVAVLCFVAVVVAIPAGRWAALGATVVVAAALCVAAKLPAATVLRRLAVETPFLVFALAMPFVALGDRVHLGPLALSVPGLVAGGSLLLKATTGVLAAIALSATSTPRELLAGIEALHLPAPLVAIASFMIRYAAVVTDDLSRMRTARLARGFAGNRLGHLRVEAAGTAALFVRSYERGERVHRAMTARGYTGRMPALTTGGATAAQWAVAGALPAMAVVAATLAGAWR